MRAATGRGRQRFRRGGSRAARFGGVGRQPGDCPFGWRGGAFPNDPYGIITRRRDGNPAKDNHGGCPYDCRNRRAPPQNPSFRRRPESGTRARGGERAFPVNPCAGSWFRRGGASPGPPHNSGTARFEGRRSKPWIPAFAGMTAGDAPYGGERGFHGFVGAVREPPVGGGIRIGGSGSFTNDPCGIVTRRRDGNPAKDNHRGLSLRAAAILILRRGRIHASRAVPVCGGGSFTNDPYGRNARRTRRGLSLRFAPTRMRRRANPRTSRPG